MKSDMWQIGVVLYLLVCGEPPWSGRTEQETLQMILSPSRTLRYPSPSRPSGKCRDFIEGLLCDDMEERMSATEALRHEWISPLRSQSDSVQIQRTETLTLDYSSKDDGVQISNAGRFTMIPQLEEAFDCNSITTESESESDGECGSVSSSSTDTDTETLSQVDVEGMLEIIEEVAGMSDDEFVESLKRMSSREVPSFHNYLSTDTSSVRTGISSNTYTSCSCTTDMDLNQETA